MSQNDSIIEYSENDAIILDKSFSDKLSNVIMQKDTLISSLKDTINNLTNIIVNYTLEAGVRKLKEKIFELIREINLRYLINTKPINGPIRTLTAPSMEA